MRLPIYITPLVILMVGATDKIESSDKQLSRVKRLIGTEEIVGILATIIDLWELIDKKVADNELNFDRFGNFSNIDLSFLNRKQALLMDGITGISKQLDRMEGSMAVNFEYTVNSILSAMPKIVQNELRFHDLKKVLKQINLQDNELKRYVSNQSAIERHTLEDWAYLASSHNGDSVRILLAKLHDDVSPPVNDPYRKSIFNLILQADSISSMCELQQSQQEMIYNLYNAVSLAEIKGYTMLQFSWMLLKIYNKGNFTAESQMFKTLYTERTIQKMAAAREAMKGADRSLYRCDPREWTEGKNYIRLTKLLQGYIENEVNLNPEGSCGQNCKFYEVTSYYGCYKNQFCAKQKPCKGQVLQCTYYDSDMNICQSSTSDRRYDWIEYENRRMLGTKGTCPNRFLTKVDSWWRYLFWHCSYCFCLCDDVDPSSDRFFSLREVTSDVANNMVITGVRFVKERQVVHIQIQQGRLEPRGVINMTQAEWVPVKAFSVMDDDVQSGIDYHAMRYQHRGIDLDDASGPTDHVLTGVRFRRVGGHLNLEITATPFTYETGKVHPVEESQWVANDNTDGSMEEPRREVKLPDPDIPTRHGPHYPTSRHDQFVLFRESSLSKDASQTTVPYIDAQAVTSNGFALSGLGLLHRGAQDSGGFVALKLITYDPTPHMNAPDTSINNIVLK